MKRKDAVARIIDGQDPEEEICVIIWSPEDVQWIAEDERIELSKSRIAEILNHLESHHDAYGGVTWDTIRIIVEEYRNYFNAGQRVRIVKVTEFDDPKLLGKRGIVEARTHSSIYTIRLDDGDRVVVTPDQIEEIEK